MRTSICVFLLVCASATSDFAMAALPLDFNRLDHVLDGSDPVGQQGWSVDISGNLAIVGAIRPSGGCAFIFDLGTGNLLHRLEPSDLQPDDLFGFTVAIDGDLAIVGSGQNNAAYIFDATTGQQIRKLVPSLGSQDFVRSVDISAGVAVVGTPVGKGAVSLYDARSGIRLARINGPTATLKEAFGDSVSIEGDTVAITSPSINGGRGDLFVVDAYTGRPRWQYGYSTNGQQFYPQDVVIDGDLIAMSGGSFLPSDIPLTYVFDRSTGSLLREIDIQVTNSDNYSNQIDLSGDRLVIGAPGEDMVGYGNFIGAVHTFDVNTGEFLGSIQNPFPSSNKNFGFAVALENQNLVVGAPPSNVGRGLAVAYRFVPEPTSLLLLCIGSISLLRRT